MFYYNSKWHQVVRSPDGESRGLPLGKLSIQRAAAMVTIIIMIMIVIIIVIIKPPNQHRSILWSKLYESGAWDVLHTLPNIQPLLGPGRSRILRKY